jgi:hypothetical protein
MIPGDLALHELVPEFRLQLESDRLVNVGWFGLTESENGYICEVHVEEEPGEWTLSVYSHVSFFDGGTHVRIGKAERELRKRLNSWGYHVGGTLNNNMVEKNQRYAGSATPWEATGWLEYLVPFSGYGLLFARPGPIRANLSPTELESEKHLLRRREEKFIRRYQPPLNNDRYSIAGRDRMKAWVAAHGPPTKIWRRK